MSGSSSGEHIGLKVTKSHWPVLDIQFKGWRAAGLLNAIEIDNHGQKLVVGRAATGDNVARCIAMSGTDGLVRGTEAARPASPSRSPSATSVWARVQPAGRAGG